MYSKKVGHLYTAYFKNMRHYEKEVGTIAMFEYK